MEKERIDKFLSNQLNISRNSVRTGIKRGLCLINGRAIKDFSFYVNTKEDNVIYDGNQVVYKRFIYLMMNKPAGVITASSDKSQKTVMDLVPEEFKRRRLAPVGRLDKDTTGLLILTDDGDFAHKCISPKSNLEKVYIAGLDGEITAKIADDFKKGVTLADGYICRPAKLYDIGGNYAEVTVTEGKYHQIKRMFGAVGLGVNSLHRVAIGGLVLPNDLAPGECREIVEITQKIKV